ncbi:MAG: hypothetical protein AVDCRST_MAG49-3277, partial [uncultured Thermomicrobiales bacterium]
EPHPRPRPAACRRRGGRAPRRRDHARCPRAGRAGPGHPLVGSWQVAV